MKQATTKTETKVKQGYFVNIRCLGNKTINMAFSDQQQARDTYDLLRNTMVFAGEAIREINLK